MAENRINYRDRVRSIKYPSEGDIKYNLWDPRFPPFDPVILLKELSQPMCPKYYYLKNIKGRNPLPHVIYRAPEQEINDNTLFRNYYRLKNSFEIASIDVLKYIVWNEEGHRLVDLPINSIQWRNLFSVFLGPDNLDTIPFLVQLFGRLQEENVLRRYLAEKGNIFFNVQIFNPEILIPPSEDGTPYEIALRRTERHQNPYRFRWNGPFPGFSIINEINFNRNEFVSYLFYTHEFIRLNEEDDHFNEFENQMIIIPSLQKLWLERLALLTLNTEYLQNFNLEFANNSIFQTNLSGEIPPQLDFARFNLRLETLDRTYSENYLNDLNVNMNLRSAQSLIIYKILQGRRPNIILNSNFECLVPDNQRIFCGLSGNLGCNMRDYVRIPPAVVVENVLTFQKYLRDEITLKSSGFYALSLFINNFLELKRHIALWIGNITRKNNVLLYHNNPLFDDDIPREQKLNAAFWSPFLFPVDLEIKLIDEESGTIITDFIENPNKSQNINDIFNYFSQNKTLPIIIGELPIEEYLRNFRRQQSAIWRAANYRLSQDQNETIEEYELRVLSYRLNNNYKRAGEGIFGNRVRFI